MRSVCDRVECWEDVMTLQSCVSSSFSWLCVHVFPCIPMPECMPSSCALGLVRGVQPCVGYLDCTIWKSFLHLCFPACLLLTSHTLSSAGRLMKAKGLDRFKTLPLKIDPPPAAGLKLLLLRRSAQIRWSRLRREENHWTQEKTKGDRLETSFKRNEFNRQFRSGEKTAVSGCVTTIRTLCVVCFYFFLTMRKETSHAALLLWPHPPI